MKWGNWFIDRRNLVLTHAEWGCGVYLTEIHSSAAMLDWIFQIKAKSWCDAQTMCDLLSALDAVLEPQENYCAREEDLRPIAKHIVNSYVARHG